MADVQDRAHKIAVRNCEPLFLSSPFIQCGHNVEKANGTITFIEYRTRIFGITCAHVYYEQIRSGKWLTLHGSERYIYQLGAFTAKGYESLFRPMRKASDIDGTDIAIIELGETIRQIHFPRKNKEAINLDTWAEPNWSEVQVPVAFGYPTEHKIQSEDFISAPLAAVAAAVTRPLSPSESTFLIASSLETDNTLYFSGMSGGPVYHVASPDTDPSLIGIVFEGVPGSSIEWQSRGEQSFLSRKDIQIRAHILTPAIFEDWLRLVGFL